MTTAWVARFTPYDLSGNMLEFAKKFNKYCVHYETESKDGKPVEPHYHLYFESDKCKKTITNWLGETFQVPPLTRGMANAYYMVKEATIPEFQLGYVQKQKKLICTNIAQEQLEEAQKVYASRNVKHSSLESQIAPLQPRAERSEAIASKDNIEEQYLAYYVWMKKQIADRDAPPVGATYFRIKTVQYFNELSRDRGGVGLLPVGQTRNRFSLSFYYEYLRKTETIKQNIESLEKML